MTKFINFFYNFCIVIIKSNFLLKSPKKTNLLIFDNESYETIKILLNNYSHEKLVVRRHYINEVYINFNIIFNTLIYYRGNIFSSYLIALIKEINPKVIFTFIDNSIKFSELAKRFNKINKKIHFIALQNGTRFELLENQLLYRKKIISTNPNTKIFIPTLLSFGKNEKILYKKLNIHVRNIIPAGNLALEHYLDFKKKNKIKIKKKNQLCLISDHGTWNQKIEKTDTKFVKNYYKLFNYFLKYAFEKKMKIVICAKRYKLPTNHINFKSSYFFEKKAFIENVDKKYQKFLLKNLVHRNKKKFQSYFLMEESDVVVGTFSTLLKDNIFLRNKTFICNTTKNSIYNYPIKSFCSKNLDNYNDFKVKLSEIHKMSNSKYINKLGNNIDYCIYKGEKIKNSIQKILNKKLI